VTDVLDRPTTPPAQPPDAPRRSLRERLRGRTLVHTDRGRALVIAVGTVVVLLVAVYALTVGGAGIGLGDALTVLGQKASGTVPTDPDAHRVHLQVWELRVPRVLLALLAGAALAVAGVLFQGLLRNPLVSPYTLGIAPAAAFGAAFAILFVGPRDLGSSGGVGWVVVGALSVALLSSVVVLLLGAIKRGDPATLILLGIAVTQFFTAATSALQYTADQETLALIVQWTWGSVNGAEWFQVGVVALLVAVVFPLVQRQAGNVNAIAFAGDDAATSLGVPVARVRLGLIFTAVVITAVTIAFTGIIGFVGLVGPHIARLLIGGNHRFLLPFSMLTGGLLLVVADSVGRVALEPAVVPVGIVDALVGAPIFLYLILARRRAAA